MDHPAQLFIIRGTPGSGKTTLAKLLAESLDAAHFEADMYFTDSGGNYNFNAEKLAEAHRWCLDSTKAALSCGKKVIVSNTFIKLIHMQDYFNLTTDYVVICMENFFGSIHNVPTNKIKSMFNSYERY